MAMPAAPETLDGWFVLHDFRRLRAEFWDRLTPAERGAIAGEVATFLASEEELEARHEGSGGIFQVLGHKADLLFVHLRPSVAELAEVEETFAHMRFAPWTERPYSYLSVVELSTHGSQGSAEELRANPSLRLRLEPVLPKTRYISFYPMSKLRSEHGNWYLLDPAERRELMRSHGLIGRKYQGRIVQIITGSMGLDDWEWGVDLFSDDALQFKKIVYEMRFDEASARYGLFGPFFTGIRLDAEGLRRYLTGEEA
jgi:peroxiredoxin